VRRSLPSSYAVHSGSGQSCIQRHQGYCRLLLRSTSFVNSKGFCLIRVHPLPVYTNSCSQISTFAELTHCRRSRIFQTSNHDSRKLSSSWEGVTLPMRKALRYAHLRS
jgi:hypothetical protein